MKKYTIWIALFCLILCFAGCNSNDVVETTIPTTAPPTTAPPTEPAPDPVEIYTTAMDLLGTDAVGMNVYTNQTMTTGGQVFESSSFQKRSFWNLGADGFAAQVEDSTDLVEHAYTIKESYIDGSIYMELGEGLYTTEMEAEDYLSRYHGPQFLDPALYTLTLEENDTRIRFSDATALESWLTSEDSELIRAEGYLDLDGQGKPTYLEYTAEYVNGNTSFVTTYTVYYVDTGAAPAVPENVSEYLTVTDIDGMWLMEVGYGYMLQSSQYTARILNTVQSQAAGMMINKQYDLNTYNTGKTVDYLINSSVFAMDSTGEVQQESTEKFINGKYTITVDDGEEQTSSAVSSYVMQTAAELILTMPFLDSIYVTDASITHMGSLILVEYTMEEDLGNKFQQNICSTYFGSPDLLDELASSYTTNKMEFYIALDAFSMLPTACGYLYEGCHTIDGYDCLLVEQTDVSYDMASLTSHETIYEEPTPDTEPEEKATPLFYHVTGPEGQEMWLFGTIHVGDDRTAFLPQEIYDALLSSVALAVECDTESFDEQVEEDEKLQDQVSSLYYYDDGTIADHLQTEDLYEDAKKVLKATGGYFFNSEYQTASVWSSNIDNYYLSQGRRLVSEKGVERRLEKIAEENNIPLWEIESNLFQLEMLMGFSDNLQEFQLYSSVYANGRDSWESTEELYELWCAGDEAALIEEMARESWEFTEEDLAEAEADENLTEEDREKLQKIRDSLESINAELEEIRKEYIASMETDRNLGMLNKAIEYLESGDTVFYAVGLAHLIAEDGLVFALREAGYTVELVTFK